MRFNVPFILDESYIGDLTRLGERLSAVHFSLNQPVLADARIHFQSQDLQTLIDGLQRVPTPRRYLLANGRFQSAEHYRSGGGLTPLIESLDRLMAAGVLDGIIFSDGYLLKALSKAMPRVTERLEAIPSINFMIDSFAKLASVLMMIDHSHFRPPVKITLDRSLNRRPVVLRDLAEDIRRHHAGMQIELLANEGCLNHCAFRATHEAIIAAINAGAAMDTFKMNRDLGCVRTLSESPHRILASPFIRPEDLSRYIDVADVIKVCGRTLGSAFLRRTVAAYAAECYEGNLFDLLDAAHWMGQHWDLPNDGLPESLLDRLTACDQNCTDCTMCREMFAQHARKLPIHIDVFDKPEGMRCLI